MTYKKEKEKKNRYRTHLCTRTHTHTHTHIYTHTHMHAKHTYVHTHTHTYTYKTHTHTHTHTLPVTMKTDLNGRKALVVAIPHSTLTLLSDIFEVGLFRVFFLSTLSSSSHCKRKSTDHVNTSEINWKER